MIASEFADLYVTCRESDVFEDVAAAFKNRLRCFGWSGQVRKGRISTRSWVFGA
jgi:hypothetical protein